MNFLASAIYASRGCYKLTRALLTNIMGPTYQTFDLDSLGSQDVVSKDHRKVALAFTQKV